jgi:hypothetical protein
MMVSKIALGTSVLILQGLVIVVWLRTGVVLSGLRSLDVTPSLFLFLASMKTG